MTNTLASLVDAVDDAAGRLAFVAGTALMGHYCDEHAVWEDTDAGRAAREISERADALFDAARELWQLTRTHADILHTVEDSAGMVSAAELHYVAEATGMRG